MEEMLSLSISRVSSAAAGGGRVVTGERVAEPHLNSLDEQ